jgi:hypothetical protein
MPKGFKVCPPNWKEEAVKVCIFCGENFWPSTHSHYLSWIKRQHCDQKCSKRHEQAIKTGSRKP